MDDATIDKALDDRLQLRARVTELEEQLEQQPREIAAWLEQNVDHLPEPVAAALTQAAGEIRELAWK